MIPIDISARAIEEIKQTMAQKNIPPTYGLRIGVRGGGCAGVSYILGFDQQNEGDGVYDLQGIPLYIAKKDLLFLMRMKIDFHNGNDARGFVFLNADQEKAPTLPNAHHAR
jgi:iron-sulfur cluster assembly protein